MKTLSLGRMKVSGLRLYAALWSTDGKAAWEIGHVNMEKLDNDGLDYKEFKSIKSIN